VAEADPDVTEQVLEPAPFGLQAAAPEHYPFLFSFQGEDGLELTSWNNAAGVTITIQGRIHIARNQVVPFTHTHTANTDRSAKTTFSSLPRGELLNLIAFVSAGAPALGQTFVRVAVRRGAGSAFERLGVLVQGPITASIFRAFPGSVVVSPFEADPFLRGVTGTTPAAGAEILETVPTGARWELVTVRFSMNADANLPNRRTDVRFKAGANVIYQTINANTWTQFNQPSFTVAPNVGYQYNASTLSSSFPSPQLSLLRAGDSFGTTTAGIQVGDQYSAPQYAIREWLDI
jgi:hypothetical protein